MHLAQVCKKKVDNGKFVIHGTDDSEADEENWKLMRKNIDFFVSNVKYIWPRRVVTASLFTKDVSVTYSYCSSNFALFWWSEHWKI